MITVDELKKIAALAKLSLDGEDVEALRRDIDNVLEFADTIAQAAVDLPEEAGGEASWRFREDVCRPSYPAEEILKNAGERQDGFFVARQRGGLI
ncbi:aspartyl/glutamyl-tRNA(Asn/Gln) amidotransferase subunit C [Sporobacter termitidis DSM 10068]|uniref:Aspartyl/glutamyl-tRNA(Asn/Gln) amidotransferase subunit C n=1 Tax=Sporobacter termitidis DSM 10068 TaxID=1123282 RepID=A0A1M5X306_9FIRM|nr:aspartyl/glutamyl-tRNA amidotransferase subunit C [Sporobacter termitidis]SHH94190.1 aspartyl/glutamyl-tRNA(Asn/Gln) amidotransferase subunit C [Sporobacter termitidis DSM 10068]